MGSMNTEFCIVDTFQFWECLLQEQENIACMVLIFTAD